MSVKATDNQEDIKAFLIDTIRTSPEDWKEMVFSCPGMGGEIVNTVHTKADGRYRFSPPTYSKLIC